MNIFEMFGKTIIELFLMFGILVIGVLLLSFMVRFIEKHIKNK